MITENYYRTRLRVSFSLYSDHYTILDLWLPAQCLFQIFWMNVGACRCNYDFFLASFEIQIPLCIQRANVAGAIPALVTGNCVCAAGIPVAGGHTPASNQNFAIWRKLDLAAGENFADRAFSQLEWMVDADQRRRLRQSIALNDGVSQAAPEFFGFGVESGAACDKRPELPSKLAADSAEDPPAVEKMFVLRICETLAKGFDLVSVFQVALDFLLQ